NKTDERAWAEFLSYVDGIIGPPITALLKRWMAGHANGSSGIALIEEIEDLKHRVLLRMIRGDYHALRQFKGDCDPSLQVYLIKIAVTVVLDYLNQIQVKVRYRATYSLNDIPPKYLDRVNRVSRDDRQSEMAILMREINGIVYSHSRADRARRDLKIL